MQWQALVDAASGPQMCKDCGRPWESDQWGICDDCMAGKTPLEILFAYNAAMSRPGSPAEAATEGTPSADCAAWEQAAWLRHVWERRADES